MKKLLLFLLLLPLFAHAQDPKPPTPIILGSQFYKSITGSDTSYYVFDTKTSLWRRLVTYRESILPFTNNFKLLGDTVDLADTIHALHSFINVDTLHPVAKFLGYNRSTNPSSIVEFWQDGVLKAFEGEAGGHYGSGIAYISGQDYSLVSTELTGTTISRNRADTNAVFKLKNYALSGHADFLNIQNALVKIDYLGIPYLPGITDTTGLSKGLVVDESNGKIYKQTVGGGGGGNTIYTASDSLVSDRLVKFLTHSLEFGDIDQNKTEFKINPAEGISGTTGLSRPFQGNAFFGVLPSVVYFNHYNPSGASASINMGNNSGPYEAIQLMNTDSLSRQMGFELVGDAVAPFALFHNTVNKKGLSYADTASYSNLDSLGMTPLAVVVKQVPTKRHVIYTPTTGDVDTAYNNRYIVISGASSIADLTLVFPSTPHNGDCIYIKIIQGVSDLHFENASFAGDIQDNGWSSNTLLILVYDEDTGLWY